MGTALRCRVPVPPGPPTRSTAIPPTEPSACAACGATAAAPGWCDQCGHRERLGARRLLGWLAPGHDELELPSDAPDPLGWDGYGAQREQAAARTGTDEAVVATVGNVAGEPGAAAVLVAFDFRFLGGSMGSGTGRRIAAAYDRATALALPVVILAATGGARMQEGMASLVQMAATTAAAGQHADAGLLQVAVLRDPTTGGVFASHVNLADLLVAEPGATIGFAGPRVAETMTGGPLPTHSHTAHGALQAGLVDAVVPRPDLPAHLAAALRWAADRPGVTAPTEAAVPPGAEPDAWAAVEASRAATRPRLPAYLGALEVGTVLRGDRAGGDDPTVAVGLGRLGGAPVVVVGMDRTRDQARITPAGYRKAWRGFALAERLGLPLVTLVDTPGADAGAGSEAGGIAAHIARTMRALLDLDTPTVTAVIGEGGSGGALALAVTDRLLIQETATFSVIAPEGAAAILERDAARAADVAARLAPTAHRLAALGIADEVVAEPDGGHVEETVAALRRAVAAVEAEDPAGRVARRRARWRDAGRT